MKPCIAIPSYNRPNAMALHRVKDVGLKVYKNTRKTGAEDYYLQYMLMKNGFNTGKVGLVEYGCPTIGNISDGTKDTMIDKYNRFIRSFKKNVCDDESLVTTKTTKTGVPSLQFVWKNWGGYTIPIKRKDD